ncbi:MAG: hypothetical protein HOK52_07380 [Candidatus Marinimicrobia bacterium]|jgi:hypothetical protein|nr:hypothetical protein [Candidatus Woesearchaeota archaeon]MBT6471064.1 hypothetical protein [Candidatus Neomarinimicrobiota bacterium]
MKDITIKGGYGGDSLQLYQMEDKVVFDIAEFDVVVDKGDLTKIRDFLNDFLDESMGE